MAGALASSCLSWCPNKKVLRRCGAWRRKGTIVTYVEKVFKLNGDVGEDAHAAFEYMESGRTMGKVVVEVAPVRMSLAHWFVALRLSLKTDFSKRCFIAVKTPRAIRYGALTVP